MYWIDLKDRLDIRILELIYLMIGLWIDLKDRLDIRYRSN